MARKRRSHSGMDRSTILILVAVVLGAVIIAAGLVWDRQRSTVNAADYPAAATPMEFTTTEETKAAPLQPVLDQLSSEGDEVSILVIGDSTSNDPGEWPTIVGERLASTTGRPVMIQYWDAKENTYGRETATPGDGEPITIVNYSAPGQGPNYSLEHFSKAVTERPDLAIINHGHNTTGPDLDNALGRTVLRLTDTWDEPPAIMTIFQNPRTDRPDQSEKALTAARAFAERRSDVTMIDVRTAFEARGTDSLLSDQLHPNGQGSQVWAEVVATALGI